MDKIAIVTGASRGIGIELVRALVGADHKVFAVARDGALLEQTYATEIAGGSVVPIMLDVSNAEAVASFFATHFGSSDATIDLLFNNAGIGASIGPVWESDPAVWWRDLEINLLGVFLMTRSALKIMRHRDRGAIVNMDGGRPVGGTSYGASKAAVLQFTKTLDDELRLDGSNIAVYAAVPGLVETDMTRTQATSPVALKWNPYVAHAFAVGNVRQPQEIAAKLIKLLPLMNATTSGQYFHPGTPDGKFEPMPKG
jgi:NAD(P)-dependent dehydrogenase (short-subunit alcohol dehydrogenase family)